MSHNIIDEYLVRLGFDADSSQGKEFVSTYKQIQDQMNQSDNVSQRNEQNAQRRFSNEKSRNQSMKGQYAWIAEVEKAFASLHRTTNSFASGNPLGAVFNAYRAYQMSKTMLNGSIFGRAFGAGKTSSSPDSSSVKRDEDEIAKDVSPSRIVTATSPSTFDGIIRQIMKDTGRIAQNTSSGGGKVGSLTTPRSSQDWIDHIVNQVQNGSIQRSKNGSLDWKNVQKYIKEFQDQNRGSTNTFKSENLSSGKSGGASEDLDASMPAMEAGGEAIDVGGEVAAGGAAGGGMEAGAAAGAIGAGTGAGGPIGAAIAAAVVLMGALVVATTKFADELAQANVNVESVARNFWMTTNNAWQMTNVLSAMGKTTNDLATIAANPTLRQQYEDLQQYQQQFAQLPSDFQDVNDKWTKGVSTQAAELKLQLGYLKEISQYNLEKMLYTPVSSALSELNKFFQTLSQGLTHPNSKLNAKTNTKSSSSSSSTGSVLNKSQAEQELNGYNWNWSSSMPSKNYYVPNSSGTAAGGASITHNPNTTVNVYTNSSDPSSVGNATGNAVNQANAQSQSALIKQIQGVNR